MKVIESPSAALSVESERLLASSPGLDEQASSGGSDDLLGSSYGDPLALAEPDDTLIELNKQLKHELVERFERGERPTAAEYLEKFPQLVADRDRVVSLIYEEYCLREEHDEQPTPEEFCQRYDAWRDSLASQLRYHRLLSSVVEVKPKAAPKYPKPGELFAGRFRLCGVLGEGERPESIWPSSPIWAIGASR